MNIEHFKKRLIHQHQKPVLETAAKSAKDDPDDDASSNSSGSSGSNDQKQGKKKEGAVQSKVARKRAVCRSKFRHNSLKIFKLGSSIPTSLCKSKEPYNVSTEKNLELCCENKKKSQNNNKKEEHTSKESITEQIIHSIEGNSKKELQRNNSKTEYSSINSSTKLPGKHILPAIVPEIPVKKQRNSLSRSSEDEQKSNGSSETSSNKKDQAKQDTLPTLIKYRRKTAGREISSKNNENIRNTSPNTSNCTITENREIPTEAEPVDQKILDKKERISPDSTSTLETSKLSTLKNTNSNSPTFQSDKVNLTQTVPTTMPLNISLPRNTSITPILCTQKKVPDCLAQNIPSNRESQHAMGESSQPNKQPPYPNTQPYSRNTEAPVTNVEAPPREYQQSQYANREIPYASIETPYANREPICASRETSYANTNHPFSQYVNRDVPYVHTGSAYENRDLPYSNIPQTYPTQQYAVQSNLRNSVDCSKSNDPQIYMPVSQTGTVNSLQLFPNKSSIPVATAENPINLSVKERNKLHQLNYQHPHYYEQYKGVMMKPTVTRVNGPVSSVHRTPGLQSKTVSGVNGIHKLNGLVNATFPEIQQQLSRCSNQNTYLPTVQVPPLAAQNPHEAEIIKSMMHMTYTIMHTSSFTVDNLITLSHFFKSFIVVLNTPTTPHPIKYYLEDIVNEVLSFVTLHLFKKSGINPILRQYTKQVLELDLQHHSDLLRDVFHLMADKCYDQEWMRSFFMLMSRSGPKYPVFSKASDNGSARKPKMSSNLNSATATPYPLPVPNYTQGKKARSNAQMKKSYKPRGPQVRKSNIQQVIPNYLTEPHNDKPGSSASGSYPTDSRYIPPKIGHTVSLNEPIPIPIEKLTTVFPEKACNMYATDNTPKNSVENSSKEEHSLLKKIIDKENDSVRNNFDSKTVIIQDKSMEVTKGDKATALIEENAQLTTSNSNKNDVTVEKISVDTLDVVIKQERSNDVITKTTEDLKLFKELLREEDRDVYNKVLKKLIGVKETRTASEVITIEDEEDSSATQDISSKDSIFTKNSTVSNHPNVVVIEDEVSTPENTKGNSDYNQKNTFVEEINEPKIFEAQNTSKKLLSSKELDTVKSNIELSTSGASLAVKNLETSTPKRPRPAESKTSATEKIELIPPKINRQVESSAVQIQIAENNVEASTPKRPRPAESKTSATEKIELLTPKINRQVESSAVQMQIAENNVEASTPKRPRPAESKTSATEKIELIPPKINRQVESSAVHMQIAENNVETSTPKRPRPGASKTSATEKIELLTPKINRQVEYSAVQMQIAENNVGPSTPKRPRPAESKTSATEKIELIPPKINRQVESSAVQMQIAENNVEASTPKRPRPAVSNTSATKKIELLTPKINRQVESSAVQMQIAENNVEASTPKRPRPAVSNTSATEKIELLTPKINRQVESSAVQMQIAEHNEEASTPKTSATEKTEPLASKMNRKAESSAVQMQIDGDNVEATTSKSPIKNRDVDTARILYIPKSAPSPGLTMENTVVEVLKSKQPITKKDVEMSISKTPSTAGRSVEPSKWNSPVAERRVEVLIRQTSTGANNAESLKIKIPIIDRNVEVSRLQSPVTKNNVNTLNNPIPLIRQTSTSAINVESLKIPITDRNVEVSRIQSPVTKNNVNTLNNPIPVGVEDISSDEDDMKPYSHPIGYDHIIKSPKRLLNAPNFNICKFIGNNEILSSLNRTQNATYTRPPSVPAGVARSESKRLVCFARVCENRESVSCNIKVNVEEPYVYSNPHFLVDESVSQPPSCNTPERISPRYAQSPARLISPLSIASDLDLLAKSGENWNNWEESKKQFLDSTLSGRRQSVETISSVGSDYSTSTDHDDNHVKLRIDTKWYRINKTVLECIPKGKLLYDREKNYLIRYFDDNQLEQFIKNVNINVMVTSSYLKQMKDRAGGYLSDNIFLTPFEVTEKNEVIQLSSDPSFTKDDNICDAVIYVQEFQKVEKFVPKDFFRFYRYVTGYQIANNHYPISFQTFLTMHNTNRIKSLFKQYLLSVLENRKV